jgi:two-component system, NtrC family, response regulator AtoC
MATILIVDDEGKMRALLAMALDGEGYRVEEAPSAEEAAKRLASGAPDLVITDVRMGGQSGLELLRECKARVAGVEWIVMTAYADARTGIEAMRLGAFEYVAKPFEMDHMLLLVRSALEKRSLRREVSELRSGPSPLERIAGSSAAMRAAVDLARLVAPRDTTVLVRGPSGTGKELIARGIHAESGRGAFVPVNCAALTETLLESELFGHEKGSFTGAHARKAGLFEQAADGTIFLDEIGEVSLALQVKLLRVLQEREFTRVGGSEVIGSRARVIAATNRDLEAAVKDGQFREDLYYRLSVFPIAMPPLSARREDIPALVETFLLKHKHAAGISASALDKLCVWHWPGNVRELENCVERTVILARGAQITPEHLPAALLGAAPADAPRFVLPPEGISLDEVEKACLLQALASSGGNKTRAAELLGISRRAIYSRMKTHGLDTGDEG